MDKERVQQDKFKSKYDWLNFVVVVYPKDNDDQVSMLYNFFSFIAGEKA